VEFRRLGRSGLTVSEIAYGNWITHGSQVEEDAAKACVQAALDSGITTFDTADVYARTRAESVLGRALSGVRRESYELFTKAYWPTGPGQNDRGLGRKHLIESCHASLRRLGTDYVDLYQAHRYDRSTPLEETMLAYADLVRQGKVLYVGVSEWRAEQIAAAAELARELRVPLISNQPQYSMLWRVIEAEVVPTCEREGMSQLVFSPIGQGVLTGKYQPGAAPPAGSRATDEKGGANFIRRMLTDEVLTRVQALRPIADECGLSMAQLAVAWVLQNPNVSAAIIGASRPDQVVENVKASGVRLEPAVHGPHRPGARRHRRAGPGPYRGLERSSRRPGSALGRGEGHRVFDAVALDEHDLGDTGVEQVAPGLAQPGLGVALRAEGLVAVRRRQRPAVGVLVAPLPRHARQATCRSWPTPRPPWPASEDGRVASPAGIDGGTP
jgi:aryl-alcohol dehydrogenase-like predicted oxidoreductase